jgi:hypothetical protein
MSCRTSCRRVNSSAICSLVQRPICGHLEPRFFQAQSIALANFDELPEPEHMPLVAMSEKQVLEELPTTGFGVPAIYGLAHADTEEEHADGKGEEEDVLDKDSVMSVHFACPHNPMCTHSIHFSRNGGAYCASARRHHVCDCTQIYLNLTTIRREQWHAAHTLRARARHTYFLDGRGFTNFKSRTFFTRNKGPHTFEQIKDHHHQRSGPEIFVAFPLPAHAHMDRPERERVCKIDRYVPPDHSVRAGKGRPKKKREAPRDLCDWRVNKLVSMHVSPFTAAAPRLQDRMLFSLNVSYKPQSVFDDDDAF